MNFEYIQNINIEFELFKFIPCILPPVLGQWHVALSWEITIYGRSVIAGMRVGEVYDT